MKTTPTRPGPFRAPLVSKFEIQTRISEVRASRDSGAVDRLRSAITCRFVQCFGTRRIGRHADRAARIVNRILANSATV